MTDATPFINQLLAIHNAGPIKRHLFSLDRVNTFLREAYQINSRITELLVYLRSVRRPYLRGNPPTRRKPVDLHHGSHERREQYLTDAQRDKIDAEAKSVLRDLHAAVYNLSQAEQIRQAAEVALNPARRQNQRFGALSSWAHGGGNSLETPEEELRQAQANTIKLHREGVLWYLRRRLEECGRKQSEMMETRLREEVEKTKSMMYKSRSSGDPVFAAEDDKTNDQVRSAARQKLQTEAATTTAFDDFRQGQLNQEQMQLFAEENQDMMKLYEDRLGQVRAAEKSLLEISELQSALVANLELQSAHIDQLVEDSYFATENVGGGNRELKRATERTSTAYYTFLASGALCVFLIGWDALPDVLRALLRRV